MPRHPSAPAPLLKYVVGVDIAKDSFTACLGCVDLAQQVHFFGKVTTFSNDVAGFRALQVWATARQGQPALPLGYVLEATGVYYEELAYYLHTQQQTLSVLLGEHQKCGAAANTGLELLLKNSAILLLSIPSRALI